MIVGRTAVLVLLALGLAACKKEDVAEVPPRPVLTTTVTPVTTEMFGPFASLVEARYQTQLGFQTSGRMIARNVYVGDTVKKGQRMALLDPTLAQFALVRAKADVVDAKAQLANAEGIESRQKILAQGGNATQATLDNAVAGMGTAKARLDQTLAALHVAEDQVGYTELHANFDGVVTNWSAEVGQFVNNGQAVVTIARPDIREAVVDIPDDQMLQVEPGMEFDVLLQASPGVKVRGRVRQVDPLADSATRSHRVRLTLEDPTPAFRIGTTVTVESRRAIKPEIFIPAAAVIGEGDKTYVWVLSNDGRKVDRRDITVTRTDGGHALIGSGLAAGDRVVTVGVHSLHDGQPVAGVANNAAAKVESTRL